MLKVRYDPQPGLEKEHSGSKLVYIPLPITPKLDERLIDRWRTFYEGDSQEFDRKAEEGLWRRTQDPRNRMHSGWKSPDDKRRRLLHYRHSFDLVPNADGTHCLALVDTYFWLHLCFPTTEIAEYQAEIASALRVGGWKKSQEIQDDVSRKNIFRKGDLVYETRLFDGIHPQDVQVNRRFPSNYRILEITVMYVGHQLSDEFIERPWHVLNTGIRTKDVRENPTIITDENVDTITDFWPTQIELGCGPSVEAGIPPLHFLHQVYYVTNPRTQKFLLCPKSDKLACELAVDTLHTFSRFALMFKKCFLAEPTEFHKVLSSLRSNGWIVGDIITNNFDGLCSRLGFKERVVRRFEESLITPSVDFDPHAHSLTVVGSHADRRGIQKAARRKGLKIIYIDPEGFETDNGFYEYPLESPKSCDLLYRETATRAFRVIASRLLAQW